MAFPVLQQSRATQFTSLATAHNVLMPTTVNAGDTLICAFMFFGAATTVTTPSGWTLHGSLQVSGSARGAVYSKIADGSEDGASVDWVTGATRRAAAVVARFSGGPSATSSIEVTYATGSSATPDPPSETAAGGSADIKWMAGYFLDNNTDVVTDPTNYTTLLHTDVNAAEDFHIGTAHRDLATATENPGTFASEDVENWVAFTIVIPPGVAAFTGTVAVTQADQTSSASGTVTSPPITGTVAATQANQTSVASGQAGVQGTVAVTQANQIGAATGQLGASGTVSVTQEDQVGAASGTITAGGAVTGTVAATQEDQTSTASGTVVNVFSGTVAVTQEDQTATATGTVVPPSVTGTVAVTQDDQTAAGTGIFFEQITGTVDVTQEDQTSTATGLVSEAPLEGSVAVVQQNQVAVAVGISYHTDVSQGGIVRGGPRAGTRVLGLAGTTDAVGDTGPATVSGGRKPAKVGSGTGVPKVGS